MKKEQIDLNLLLDNISSLISAQDSKQKALLKISTINGYQNICVTIYSKYLKRLFTLRFAVENQIRLRKEKIDILTDNDSKNEVLESQFIFSRFDFYFGTFSLFEDFIATIAEIVLTKDVYHNLKPNIKNILSNKKVNSLIQKNFPKEYNIIKECDEHIPLIRKAQKLEPLNPYLEDIRFLSTVRNIVHRNGFYHGTLKSFPKFGKEFTDGSLFQFSMDELLDWSNAIFQMTYILSDTYKDKLIQDQTISA